MTFVDDQLRFEDHPGSGSAGSGSAGSDDPDSAGTEFEGMLQPGELRPTFELLTNTLMAMPTPDAMVEISWLKRNLAATEARVLAAAKEQGLSDREAEDLADQGGKKSKANRKKAAKRGEAVKNNPRLANDVEDGSVSEEQFDDLADADAKTDGAASKNPELMDDVRGSNADQSKDLIKAFVNNHNAADDETEHQRQRRLRKMSRFSTKRGTEAIMAEGDGATIDYIWDFIRSKAQDLYTADGGRDRPKDQHDRTHAQRMFDAFANQFTPASGDGTDSGSRQRPTIVLGATINDDGVITDLRNADGSPVPPSVFDRYFCNAELIGMLFDGKGQPLWQGHSHRHATRRQLIALIARDRGCVLCRAPHDQCVAHHLIPWAAPLKGKTDIDNMALVCQDCHHRIHDTKQTLFQNEQGVWKLRQATADEIPPDRPSRGADRTRPQRE